MRLIKKFIKELLCQIFELLFTVINQFNFLFHNLSDFEKFELENFHNDNDRKLFNKAENMILHKDYTQVEINFSKTKVVIGTYDKYRNKKGVI